MIDWLTVKWQSSFPIEAGCFLLIGPDGQVERQSERRLKVEGSFSANVSVRNTHPPPGLSHLDGFVEVSGNPAKWFQGQNVFGTSDVRSLVPSFIESVAERLGHRLSIDEHLALQRGDAWISRLDTTQNWDFQTLGRAQMVVRSFDGAAMKFRSRGEFKQGTVYWGKPTHAQLKVYAKGEEISSGRKGHGLPVALPFRSELMETARGFVRFELQMSGDALADYKDASGRKPDYRRLKNWIDPTLADTMLLEAMEKLQMPSIELRDEVREQLSSTLRRHYDDWLSGYDMRERLSYATYYRIRAKLLPFGVDIGEKREREARKVFPIGVVLHGHPAVMPERMRPALFFDPAAATKQAEQDLREALERAGQLRLVG